MLKSKLSKVKTHILTISCATLISIMLLPNTALAYVSGTWSNNRMVGYGYQEVGINVKSVQAICTSAGYSTYGIDGYYGANTQRGIKGYQSSVGLSADGIVGPNTWNVMHSALHYSYSGDGPLATYEVYYYPGSIQPQFLNNNPNYGVVWEYYDNGTWQYIDRN